MDKKKFRVGFSISNNMNDTRKHEKLLNSIFRTYTPLKDLPAMGYEDLACSHLNFSSVSTSLVYDPNLC